MARKCPICGSGKWRKNAEGLVVCEDGHVLQGVRSESTVMTEPTAHALQKRRILKGGPRINKRKEFGRADKALYHGREAEWLRLQGLQLLLRHQIQALQKLWSIPDALEAIARDLWTYQLLVSRVAPEDSRSPSPGRAPRKNSRKSLADDATTPTPSDGEDTERAGDDSDSDGDAASVVSEDPDLLALDQDTDDDDDDDDETGDKAKADTNKKDAPAKEPWKRSRPIRVSDVLVTTVLALWILRVPFTYARLEQLINTNEIPYIDFARTTLLPADMVRHMNRAVVVSLRPQRAPSPAYLFALVRQFARTLTIYFDVKLPEVNLPPVAWHVVSQLGGNAMTYEQVVRFLGLVDANMSITDTYAAHERKRRNSEPQTIMRSTRLRDLHMPELSIAAAWVIVMKLAYGLDGQPSSDPAIGMPRREMWLAELDRRVKNGAFKGTLQDMKGLQFHTMDGEDIDRFLNRSEHVLLKDRDHGTGGSMFPLPPRPKVEERDSNSWAAFHALAAADPVPQAKAPDPNTPNAELPLLPGEAVRIYDASARLPRDLAIVVAAAADVVGVSQDAVRDLVTIFERRMEAARPKRAFPETLVARKLRPALMASMTGGYPLRESRSFSSFGEGV